jgi:hypothetical protein
MHGPIHVKSPNNTSKWQMGFNSPFKGLIVVKILLKHILRGYIRFILVQSQIIVDAVGSGTVCSGLRRES